MSALTVFDLLQFQGGRLTREQYIGVLGQEYHLSRAAPANLRAAADRLASLSAGKSARHQKVSDWLRKHASEEDGHFIWALQDLNDLGVKVPPPQTYETTSLLVTVQSIATSTAPYRILGLSDVVEHFAPTLKVETLLPEGIGEASRFIGRHSKVDVQHAKEVDEAIGWLSDKEQGEVRATAKVFESLFRNFLLAAARSGHQKSRL